MTKIMKLSTGIIMFILPVIAWPSCTDREPTLLQNQVVDSTSETMKDTVAIIIGKEHFTAVLETNATTDEFKKMLPLTIDMKDLNSNEKFFDLAHNLPANATSPQKINPGDLMLWGSNTLVLFYKAFNTSYRYTRLGKIENASGLSQALGSGNVTVRIELLAN